MTDDIGKAHDLPAMGLGHGLFAGLLLYAYGILA